MTEDIDGFHLVATDSRGVERTSYLRQHMLSHSCMSRQETIYPPGESPAEKEIARKAEEARRLADWRAQRRGPARNHVKEQTHE
jgi:hypothetical protein